MSLPELKSDRFVPEQGLRITVQTPEISVQTITHAILGCDALKYGDYDRVTFRTAVGTQQFRSLGRGRNRATETAVDVPCIEVSFFLHRDEAVAVQVIKAIYGSHPYEEPVIFVQPVVRALHIRGLDEDNPNRFWNNDAEDWVPEAHR